MEGMSTTDSPSQQGLTTPTTERSPAKLTALWQAVLAALRRNPVISPGSFQRWLATTALQAQEGDEFVVAGTTTYHLGMLERTFRRLILAALQELVGPSTRVRFVVAPSQPSGPPAPPAILAPPAAALTGVLFNTAYPSATPDQILRLVSNYFGVSLEALRGKQRDRPIVLPRQIAMYVMREDTAASLVEIGQQLGGRDHSTVRHGRNKIAGQLPRNAKLREQVHAIRALLPGLSNER